MGRAKILGLILLTPVFILLTHALAMLPHEYSHSFTAWLLGYKNNPFALTYGGTSWSNLLFLLHMDENVDYPMIFSMGQNIHAGLIAFAGIGINILLFIFSLWALTKEYVKEHPYLYYFLFLFNLMNLGNFYDYVPIRTFATRDDATNFELGLNISPWWIYFIGGYIVCFLIWHFFSRTMIKAFINLKVTSTTLKAGLMMICVGMLFGFYGLPGFFGYGKISYFLSATSLLAIPGIILALWPTRDWVMRRLELYK